MAETDARRLLKVRRRLVNGCVWRMAGGVGIDGLVREEDELAVLACVNYQGTAFLSVSQNAAFRLIRYF